MAPTRTDALLDAYDTHRAFGAIERNARRSAAAAYARAKQITLAFALEALDAALAARRNRPTLEILS